MKKIPLTQGQITIVDDIDHEELSRRKWRAQWSPSTESFYAVRWSPVLNGKKYVIRMHRQILGLKHGDKREGDHVNHDTLNNRRSNLRIVTHRENLSNRRDQSKHGVGISKNPRCKTRPFRARVKTSKWIHIGYFATATEARTARNAFLKENCL